MGVDEERNMSASSVAVGCPVEEKWVVTLEDEASLEMKRLTAATGHSPESLLEISLALLGIVVDAKKSKYSIYLTHRGIPFEELSIPAPKKTS
jgi:hypothetical protein